jgi:hypothetical protein
MRQEAMTIPTKPRPYALSVLLLSISLIPGCATLPRQEPPSLSGTFSGTAGDSRPVRVTLSQDADVVTGRGLVGARAFSLSGLTSWQGPIVLAFEDGPIEAAQITLSPDGTRATIRGWGPPFTLERGGPAVSAPSGVFAGRYSTERPSPLWLVLTQSGDLLAGTGFVDGKPLAVVGRVTGIRQAAGTLLFSDESQNRVRVILSDDGQSVTIQGLGSPIEMRRER